MADKPQDTADYGLPDGKSRDDFLGEMRQRAQWCFDADDDLRIKAIDDIEFCDVPGSQWDDFTKGERAGRPCYEFNKVRQSVRQVTGDQKQNRPSIKIRAVHDATQEDADLRMGIIRNIEAISNAEQAYDTAFEYAVKGGFGAWRINTAYASDDVFDLEILVEAIQDAIASVYFDPMARKIDRRDARYAFVFDTPSRSAFRQRYPKAEMVSFGTCGTADGYDWNDWWGQETVRIAEYWYKKPGERELILLSDGRTVEADKIELIMDELAAAGVTEVRRRTVQVDEVYSCVCSGSEILEGPTLWPGKFIPIVPNWGDIIRIKGKDYWSGMVRFARDPQKLYNYERSTLVEVIGKQPKQPILAAAEAVEGYESDYADMGTSDKPVLLYNHLPDHPDGGRPRRSEPPFFPAALASAAALSSDDIKATLGIYDASLGARSNETSGRAINARKQQGDVANYVYIDNHAKAMRYTGEILDDLIGKVYDTEREMRILGQDGKEEHVVINSAVFDQQTQQWVKVNDLSAGKFHIAVDIGPSYTTQRMETAEAMSQMSQVPGPFQPLAQYAYLKNLDVPDIEDVQKAARAMLVKQGLMPPEEGEQPPEPPPPNPKDVADAKAKEAQAGKYQADAEKTQVETQQLQIETQRMAEEQHVRQAIGQQIMGELQPMPMQPPFPSNVPEPDPSQFGVG